MRFEGWEVILDRHIEEARGKPFEWGARDCALWSANWVRKATGIDLGAEWRGQYASEDEASALMLSRGFSCPADIASKHLDSIPVSFAQRGDIVKHGVGALGICFGRISYFLTPGGLASVPTKTCLAAWRVG